MNQVVAPQAVYDELDLGSARGGKAGTRQALEVSIVRPLVDSDLPAILQPPVVTQPNNAIQAIRHSHHKLAQLIAEGKQGTEISFLTGYSQSYLSKLQGDPAFEELVTYYATQQKTIFADAQERLKALALDATEVLHERLHDPEQVWSKKDLMDVVKMGLPVETGGKPGLAQPSNLPNGGFTLNVKFVGASPEGAPTQVLDGSFTELAEN